VKDVKSLGFIGLGNMGFPMVMSLLRLGFQVYVYDSGASENLKLAQRAGAIVKKNLSEIAEFSKLIITMLPNSEILSEVLFGSDHFCTQIQPGTIVIDTGSSNPAQTQLTAKKLAALNIGMIDAPVMGGVVFAKDATLDFLVGGSEDLISKCEPILSAMGRSITYCGPIGSGHALKALTNYINTATMANVIEAIHIGKAFGIDETVMSKSLIETCTGRNHPIIKKIIPQVLTKNYDSGMAISLVEKDLKIALDIAVENKCVYPLLDKTIEIIGSMVKVIGPNADQTKIAKFWENKF
jgi:3-hydroxyisobutyrate dehydrogenase